MVRIAVLATAAIALALGGIVAQADSEYPNRPVRLIAAAAPGGNPDVLARLLSQKLSGAFGKAFVVEKARYQAMPDVPTIGETVPGFEMSSWHGIFAPAATTAPVIARLNAAIREVLRTEAVKEKLGVLGVAVATSTPEELADIVKTGLTSRGELVKAANIQPE